jgi:hypothetical protein
MRQRRDPGRLRGDTGHRAGAPSRAHFLHGDTEPRGERRAVGRVRPGAPAVDHPGGAQEDAQAEGCAAAPASSQRRASSAGAHATDRRRRILGPHRHRLHGRSQQGSAVASGARRHGRPKERDARGRLRGGKPAVWRLRQVPKEFPSDFTLHLIRHTVRSRMTELGVAPDIGEPCLGHAIGGIRGIYDQADFLPPVRAAFEAWSAELDRILAGSESERAQVVAFGRA